MAAAESDLVAQLAAALDYDAERIFRFVADEIRYEPYDGILRGARGVLASRAGNSADQAVLLAALLDASLLPVRFAVGELDGDSADALMASTVVDLETARQQAGQAFSGVMPGTDPAPPTLTPEQQAQLDGAVARADAVVGWARDQLEATVEMIASALDEAGVEVLDGFSTMPDSERARHVWVQVADTADWLDLDPTMPGAEIGHALATTAETMATLPDELAHEVEISVIGESLAESGLEEKLLVGVRERADVLAGQPITILNTTPDALTALGVDIGGALGGGSAYVPMVVLGQEAIVGATPIRFAAAPDSSAGADDLLEAGPSAGEATAEWVELTIRSPEREPVVVRRELFDRLGPAKRAAGGVATADLAPVEWSEDPGRPGEHPLVAMATQWLTVNTGLPNQADEVMTIVPGEDSREGALVSQLFHLMDAAAALEAATPAGVRPFADAPKVAGYSIGVRPGADGEPALAAAVDIWHRGHGTAPVAGIDASLRPGVTAGVVSHVAERVLGLDETLTEPAGRVSVGGVFEQAQAQGIRLRALQGAGTASDLPLPADARARLETALAEGWVAVVPETPVDFNGTERSGWWLVDPRTGRTVDQLDDGRGADAVEYTATQEIPLSALSRAAWDRLSTCILAAMSIVAAVLAVAVGAAVWMKDGNGGYALAFGSLGSGAFGTGMELAPFC